MKKLHKARLDLNYRIHIIRQEFRLFCQLYYILDKGCKPIFPGSANGEVSPALIVYETANNSIKELGEYGRDLGVLPTIENMPTFEAMIYYDLPDLHEILTGYDMHMTLDIGHANHAGYPARVPQTPRP